MVAYSFKKRFADQIASGEKRQTIRAHRKRHARVGEPVQLFYGMRTRQCRKLIETDPICCAVENIVLVIPIANEPAFIRWGNSGCLEEVSPEFAKADGFEDVEDFTQFWIEAHGAGKFEGVLIKWAAL